MDQIIFTKSYKLKKSDNFELFLKEAGAPKSELDFIYHERPTLQMRKYDNDYVLNVLGEHTRKFIKFRPNRIFTQDGYSGKKVQTIVAFGKGNVMREVHSGPRPVTIIRKFSTEKMKETLECNNVVCRRYYTTASSY